MVLRRPEGHGGDGGSGRPGCRLRTAAPTRKPFSPTLHRHVAGEEAVLDSYVQFAQSGPEFVRYLVTLIAKDEERHHRILREMVNHVVGEMEFRTMSASIPSPDFQGADRERLVEETARFLAQERDDLASLKEPPSPCAVKPRRGPFRCW